MKPVFLKLIEKGAEKSLCTIDVQASVILPILRHVADYTDIIARGYVITSQVILCIAPWRHVLFLQNICYLHINYASFSDFYFIFHNRFKKVIMQHTVD